MTEPHVGHLRRELKLRDLVLFYISAVVGLRWIALAAANGPSAFLIWAIACVALFIPLAFTVVELSSRYPDEGGIYVWSKKAFGNFAGFLTGWNYWASNLVYFPGLLFFAAGNALFIFSDETEARYRDDPTYFVLFALLGLALVVTLNVLGLGVGKWLSNVGAIGTWIVVGVILATGAIALSRFGAATDFSPASFAPDLFADSGRVNWTNIIFWSNIAFAFGGLESASTMAGEIHGARRTIPRAILAAGLMITTIYVLGTLAILTALPASEVSGLQGIMQAIDQTATRVELGWMVPVLAGVIAVVSLGGVNSWLAATSRLPFVAGIDNFLPSAFAKLHPRWRTPYVALVVQGVLAGAFVVLGQAGTDVKGAYEVLVSMGVVAYFIPYLFMFAAMVRLQWVPAGAGTLRVPGGKPVGVALGVLGFATTAFSIFLACFPPPDAVNPAQEVAKIVGASLALVAAGVVVYGIGTHRRRRAERWVPRRRRKRRARKARK